MEMHLCWWPGPLNESNNIHFHTSSATHPQTVQLLNGATLSTTSHIIDPQFVDPIKKNFHLKATSPAIDTGSSNSVTVGIHERF